MATMPARQHPSSNEAALSSGPTSPDPRSSLRRLSSLANLQQFNPFNSFSRRRSSHSTQNSDDDPYLLNTYQQQAQNKLPRQTYMSPSEEPMPILPKSSTFSNLPLTRNRNRSKPPVSMKPLGPTKPPSRIPTPSMSANTKTRLASATKSILKVGHRRGLTRSDTEPLLDSHRSHDDDVPGSTTTHKENVSLGVSTSETKSKAIELPEVPSYPTEIPARSYNPARRPQTPADQTPKPRPRRDSLQLPTPRTPTTTVPLTGPLQTPPTVTARPRRRMMLPAEVVPLHALCDKEKQRSSLSSDIQSHRLPTPRVAATLSPSSCPRPSATYLQPDDPANRINLASDLVMSAQSTAYWSGRLMSQFDQRRNEKLQSQCFGETGLTYPENDLDVCLRELQKKCVTEAAKLSFAMFKARVYVKAGTSGTTTSAIANGSESSKDMVKA